jgi:hypothetical protein
MTENELKHIKMSKNTQATLENQIKTLQTHFGAIISTVKDLKSNVEELKKRVAEVKIDEVQEIIETQRIIDEVVVANLDAVKQLKCEIKQMKGNKDAEFLYAKGTQEGKCMAQNADAIKEIIEKQHVIDETILKSSDSIKIIDKEIEKILSDKNKKDISKKEIDVALSKLDDEMQKIKELDKEHKPSEEISPVSDKWKMGTKCEYYNVGYCKYKIKCRFSHPTDVCKDNVGGKCEYNKCPKGHPKSCKRFSGTSECRRNERCEFSHDTLAGGDAA